MKEAAALVGVITISNTTLDRGKEQILLAIGAL